MTTAHEHDTLAGPAAAEAADRLARFADHARFQGQVITDPRRIKRLMQRHDPDIHPGPYITCVFDPHRALCHQQRDNRGTPQPSPSSCQPLACRNTALTQDNITQLREELEHIDHELDRRPRLPPLLAHRLASRHEMITAFLHRHTTSERPWPAPLFPPKTPSAPRSTVCVPAAAR